MPVLLVWGDSDMFRPEHMIEFYQLLGGGLRDAGWMREHMGQNRLAILPNLTHYEMFMSPALVTTALPFLNGETGAPSWAAQPFTVTRPASIHSSASRREQAPVSLRYLLRRTARSRNRQRVSACR